MSIEKFFNNPSAIQPKSDPRAVDPIIAAQVENLTTVDPLIRELYFGTADTPGFIDQLRKITQRRLESDVPLKEVAGLSELEQQAIARQQEGLDSFRPFLETAERQFGSGLEALLEGTTAARDIGRRAADMEFDPSMIDKYYDPFEEQVIQRTIDDFNRRAAVEDQALLADDISRVGESAFGSRGRLKREDLERARGRGLAESLANIRSGGFRQSLDAAREDFRGTRAAQTGLASLLGDLGAAEAGAFRASATSQQDLADALRKGQTEDIRNLSSFGQLQRGLDQAQLDALFAQQAAQQNLGLDTLKTAGGLLPAFNLGTGQRQLQTTYGIPRDPAAVGAGAGLSMYAALRKPTAESPYSQNA